MNKTLYCRDQLIGGRVPEFYGLIITATYYDTIIKT